MVLNKIGKQLSNDYCPDDKWIQILNTKYDIKYIGGADITVPTTISSGLTI